MQEDYAKVESLAQEALKNKALGPEDQNGAKYYLGLSQLRLGRNSEAQKIFKELQAVAQKGTLYDKITLALIDTYYLNDQYNEALEEAQKLLIKSPQSEFLGMIYLKIARANIKLTQWKTAKDYLEKIKNQFPDSLEAYTAKQLLEEKQYFAVQVGAFIDQSLAENLLDDLKSKNEYAYIVETTDQDGAQFYRVRVGKVTSLKEAIDLKTRLSKLGYPASIYP